jgi:hypothetical protein
MESCGARRESFIRRGVTTPPRPRHRHCCPPSAVRTAGGAAGGAAVCSCVRRPPQCWRWRHVVVAPQSVRCEHGTPMLVRPYSARRGESVGLVVGGASIDSTAGCCSHAAPIYATREHSIYTLADLNSKSKHFIPMRQQRHTLCRSRGNSDCLLSFRLVLAAFPTGHWCWRLRCARPRGRSVGGWRSVCGRLAAPAGAGRAGPCAPLAGAAPSLRPKDVQCTCATRRVT